MLLSAVHILDGDSRVVRLGLKLTNVFVVRNPKRSILSDLLKVETMEYGMARQTNVDRDELGSEPRSYYYLLAGSLLPPASLPKKYLSSLHHL